MQALFKKVEQERHKHMKNNILEINLDAVKETINEEITKLYVDELELLKLKDDLYKQAQLSINKAKQIALKELLIKLKERGLLK